MIVDTSALFAYFVRADPDHEAVAALFEREAAVGSEFVVSPLVVAELDYLILTRFGVRAELAMLSELSSGAWTIAAISSTDVAAVAGVVARYADQRVGAADASLVVLAARYGTSTVATLDQRHFEALRGLDGKPFDILP